jgi:flagellar biosynthesis/type III secretory pathway M-ring protein FliF/YscJ
MSTTVSSRSWREWSTSTRIVVLVGIAAAIAVVTFLYI